LRVDATVEEPLLSRPSHLRRETASAFVDASLSEESLSVATSAWSAMQPVVMNQLLVDR
jgi:hypothetical protein